MYLRPHVQQYVQHLARYNRPLPHARTQLKNNKVSNFTQLPKHTSVCMIMYHVTASISLNMPAGPIER